MGSVTSRAAIGARKPVRYQRDGREVLEPIGAWIADADGRGTFPELAWVFGGSRFAANTPSMGPGEHYVADLSGSIIGLVTFGDEVIGYEQVIADQEDVQPPTWQVRTGHVPTVGTEVTLLLGPR